MKNTKETKLPNYKKILLLILCWVFGFYILFFAIPNFIIFVTSDFHPDSLKIDSCYDSGGVWKDGNRECEHAPEGTLAYPYVCEQAGQIWKKGKGCLYSKEYADQYPEIEPYKH